MHLQTGLSFELFLADFTLMNCCLVPDHWQEVRVIPCQNYRLVVNGGDLLLPHFLPQVDTFIMNCEMIVTPEAFATLLTLMGFLACITTEANSNARDLLLA